MIKFCKHCIKTFICMKAARLFPKHIPDSASCKISAEKRKYLFAELRAQSSKEIIKIANKCFNFNKRVEKCATRNNVRFGCRQASVNANANFEWPLREFLERKEISINKQRNYFNKLSTAERGLFITRPTRFYKTELLLKFKKTVSVLSWNSFSNEILIGSRNR